MNIIKTIKKWWVRQNNEHKLAREAELRQNAIKDVQLIEYNGEVHVSLFGNPVVPERLLKKNALDSLKDLREVYVSSRSDK